MNEKSALLHQAFQLNDVHKRRELLLQTLADECDLPEGGFEVTVSFHLTVEDILNHKADNLAHVNLPPSQHMCEMIQDYLYDGGPLEYGEFIILTCVEKTDV